MLIRRSDPRPLPLRAAWLACALVACGQDPALLPATIELSTDTLTFDTVPVDTEAGLSFTITNAGDLDLVLNSVSLIEGEAGAWDLLRSGSDTLGGGQSAQVEVRFSPRDEDDYRGRVQIRSNDARTGSVYVSLSGLGGPSVEDNDADGYSQAQGDCDDSDASRHPGNAEVCDGKDNNCDGVVPSGEADADYDGYRLCSAGGAPVDCDDGDARVYPGAEEICDGKDSDCDGRNRDDLDSDADGYSICGDDCDDEDPQRYPDAVEVCDGKDNDCNGLVDDQDADGDGHSLCDKSGDCDDNDPLKHPEVVGAGGSAPANGTPAAPYTAVGEAVAAWGGDPDCPIFINPGTYPTAAVFATGAPLIVGAGEGLVVLTGVEGTPVIEVRSGANVELRAVTVSGGSNSRDGGAISVSGGALTLRQVTLSDNTSGGDGGAVAVDSGTLLLDGCTLTGNTAAGDGGAVAVDGGTVTLSASTLEGNQALDDGGGVAALASSVFDEGSVWRGNVGGRGGALFATGSALSLRGASLIGNTARASGGGAWIGSPTELLLVASKVWSNTSAGDGGGIQFSEVNTAEGRVEGNLVQDNIASGDGGGVAIDGAKGTFTLANNTLTSNTAGVSEGGLGAGIYVGTTGGELQLVANIVAWSRGATGLHRVQAGGTTTHNTVFNTSSQVELGGSLQYLDYDPGGQPPEANAGEQENRVENPSFTTFNQGGDPSADDLRLRAGSPAIDTGPDGADWLDPDATRNDRGAYGGPNAQP